MANIEEIEHSIEMPVGTRFYFRNRLYEVVESKGWMMWDCPKCAISEKGKEELCRVMNCDYKRHDEKNVYFKEVEQSNEKDND